MLRFTDAVTLDGSVNLTDRGLIALAKAARKPLDAILGGQTRFGLYTVIGGGRYSDKARYAKCRCDCGVVRDVETSKLLSGRSTRCKDCAKVNPARATSVTHGLTKSPEHRAWSSMKYRCTNPNAHNWADYGGRGIEVCDRWMASFESFYADMGPRPDGCSLDRIDNSKGYYPDNCRWANDKQQAHNRRGSRIVEYDGELVAVAELERRFGLNKGVILARLKMGWDIERAVSEPALDKKPSHMVFGESLTTKDIVDKYGVSRQMFNYRLRDGWTAEQIVSHYTRAAA